jgi:type IV pilus assembly protein PilY1
MKYILITLLLAWSNQVLSDDIDLYVNNSVETAERPNVLIVLDNSPSMRWFNIAGDYLNPSSTRHVNNPLSRAYKARKIVIDLINDNPEVDFGLQLFNYNNNNNHGGRIVFGLQDLSDQSDRDALIAILDSDDNNANFNYKDFAGNGTPLCETLYETYLYLSGGDMKYANNNTSIPLSIPGPYVSPFEGITCNKEITIIYITDGDPTLDDNANGLVKGLTEKIDDDAENGNFMGVLGSWMATQNFNNGLKIVNTAKSDILASVKIHTVGFGESITATNLLKSAARDGEGEVDSPTSGNYPLPAGGKFHVASNAAALKTALDTVLVEVMKSNSLTSAAVSTNSFDRTVTLDSVYYGLFEPSTAARWQGNIKKYKIVNGVQVDANGNPAVNSAGEFKDDAKSFWSDEVDGNDVSKGGVAEMLRATPLANRTFRTDTAGVGPLTKFDAPAYITDQYSDTDLTDLFGLTIGEVDDISDHIEWAMGKDVDNERPGFDVRADVFGDPLHSKPIMINYGTTQNSNARIVVSTNSGVLHMFEDVSNTEVKENWAYLPKEFFKNIKPLRDNVLAVNNKVYGLDGEMTLHINDHDNDGKVNGADTAWLFFGLRRGGHSYYAIDITIPDTPKLMWHIEKPESGTFSDLGLTFSKPIVVKSAFNKTEADKLVVIFGGGYDIKKDASGANTIDDDQGAVVYMVSATTGALLFSKNTGVKNGIAASVASLDSDRDGLVDRLYVGDTGGNVFRVDMPDDNTANSSIITLARLGGITDPEDRRFFNQPDIVRTYLLETIDIGEAGSPNIIKKEIPYDAILLGSGDKTAPINSDTTDMFFMIKDKYIKTQKFGGDGTSTPTVITLDNLSDYTGNPFEGYPLLTPAEESELVAASLQSGWHIDLLEGGEKNTAKSKVLNNVVYFTSYSPSAEATCSVVPGDAWLYAVDLAQGIKKYDWSAEPDNTRGDRIKHVGHQFVGEMNLIITGVTEVIEGEPVESKKSNLSIGNTMIPIPFDLQTKRTSLTVPETN